MQIKKFVPCIYLYGEHAVRNSKDLSVVETDPIRLAKSFCENHADEIIVFDLSAGQGDEAHDKALDVIREIVKVSEVDVIGAGNIKRLEDVKKILYTGCRKVILDWEDPVNLELTREASERFGKEKMIVGCNETDVLQQNKALAEEFAGALMLMNPHVIRDAELITEMPFYVSIENIALNKLLEVFAHENLCGVTGNAIGDNCKEILSLKSLCQSNQIPVSFMRPAISWEELKKNDQGLVPVIVQDYRTDEVLMLAYMNQKAYEDTLLSGMMNYYSRSRQEQWLKGDTSGHYQYVKSLTADCDLDTILAKVSQIGAACHTGNRSCFFNEIARKEVTAPENPMKVFQDVYDVICDRKVHPKEGSYTNYLFEKGLDKILKKVGEEATEIVIAAKNPNPNEVKYEISDFLYHMMVLMAEKGLTWEEITEELANR